MNSRAAKKKNRPSTWCPGGKNLTARANGWRRGEHPFSILATVFTAFPGGFRTKITHRTNRDASKKSCEYNRALIRCILWGHLFFLFFFPSTWEVKYADELIV
jgi:hypothetical protein